MKRGNYYNNKGGYYKNKYNNRPNQPHKDYTYRYPNDIDTVTKATENGFTGPTSSWFSDEEFFKNLSSHCDFEGKKDYYFNSYSSFNIHEEMLKDRVRYKN